MAHSLPQFLYPPTQTGDYLFNPTDQVNVSWTWDSPPAGASVGLVFWLQNSTTNLYFIASNDTGLPVDGFDLSRLKYPSAKYPNTGHFNLDAYFANGTLVGGPNSNNIDIDNTHAASPCRNCTGSQPSSTAGVMSPPTSTDSASTTSVSIPQNSTLSAGVIAGIIVTAVVVILALLIGVYFFFRRRRRSQRSRIDTLGSGKAFSDPTYPSNPMRLQRPSQPPEFKDLIHVAEKDASPTPSELPAYFLHEMSAER